MIAALEGANADHAATLALFDDLPETRSGDVPSVGRPYVTTTDARQIAADQVVDLPAELAERVRGPGRRARERQDGGRNRRGPVQP